jgi:hypothetical protein
MALSAVALCGVLGMAVDIGKMFIAKNETQTYCDSAAIAAALMLDGTTNGIANAQNCGRELSQHLESQHQYDQQPNSAICNQHIRAVVL